MPLKKLTYLLYKKGTNNCYTSFEVPKKNQETRVISVPNEDLKEIQRKLADLLYKKQSEIWQQNNISSNISHGFEKGKGIISNSAIHRNKRFVLNVDLKDFFDSFHFGRVRGYFHHNKHFKLDIETATIIAQLTCFNGVLPQGAPTSPIITNLICQILDFKLLNIAKKYKLDYTRYADDLTFSTNDKKFLRNKDIFLTEVSKVIEKSGFRINEKKTRLQYRDSKQTVTGLVVNKKINVDSAYFRETRAMAHSLYTKGEFVIDGKSGTIHQLEGRFSFINQIDKYDNQNCTEKMRNVFSLNKREREYQKFLFYKYFISYEKPLIITEGKTDVIYLKAALKNLHEKYPNLIEKKSDGNFNYKVLFLKRSKKLNYFFQYTLDGADSINNLYSYYIGEKINGFQCPDFNVIFNKYGTKAINPVIIIFDNEIDSGKEKPIRKFKGYKKLSAEKKQHLKSDLKIKLINDGNFFLVTNSLIKGQVESEIEDLFMQETLDVEIDGRKFNRKVEKGDSAHYGKDIFSKYIFENYKKIDFKNFIPLLDKINSIVDEYN